MNIRIGYGYDVHQLKIGENLNLEENPGVAKIKVRDSRRALAKMAKRYHGSPDESINIVGITKIIPSTLSSMPP